MRVMVVDDDSAVRDIIAYGVGKVSVTNRVVSFPDAETALKNYKNGDFDCLVVDYKLPGMNGIDFIREIRKKDPTVGAVVVTAVLEQEKTERLCEGLDVYSVVLKPFNNKMLAQKVQEASELSRITPEKRALIEKTIESQSAKLMTLGHEVIASVAERKSETRKRSLF